MRYFIGAIVVAALAVSTLGQTRPQSDNIGDAWARAYIEEDGDIVVACIGDSLTTEADTWTYDFIDIMQTRNGDGGGYVGAGGGFVSSDPDRARATIDGTSYAAPTSGTRTDDWSKRSFDGAYFQSWDPPAPPSIPSSIRWRFETGRNPTMLFSLLSGSTNSSTWDPDPDSVGSGQGGVIPATWNSEDEIFIEDQDVLVHGWDIATPNGFAWHRFGRGGAGAANFKQVTVNPHQVITAGVMAGVRTPDVCVVMYDQASEDTDFDSYKDDFEDVLDYLELNWPNTKFILITHHAHVAAIEDQADFLLTVAQARGHGYINFYDEFTNAELTSMGLIKDSVHLSASGGATFAGIVEDIVDQAVDDCLTDINFDGVTDFADLNKVNANWLTTGPDGDVNRDGTVNFMDLDLVLANWGVVCD